MHLRRRIQAALVTLASLIALKALSRRSGTVAPPCNHGADAEALRDPCSAKMTRRAPEAFRAKYHTSLGCFETHCVRQRAPVWVDRLFSLIANGFYDANYFVRVIRSTSLSVVQFGTSGDPSISRVYNWSTTPSPQCAVLQPQPDVMPFCSAAHPCTGVHGLSNTFGTLSMRVPPAKVGTWWAARPVFWRCPPILAGRGPRALGSAAYWGVLTAISTFPGPRLSMRHRAPPGTLQRSSSSTPATTRGWTRCASSPSAQ